MGLERFFVNGSTAGIRDRLAVLHAAKIIDDMENQGIDCTS